MLTTANEQPATVGEFHRTTVVVPVFNAMRFLPSTVPALIQAADEHEVELIWVDNGSIDESYHYLLGITRDRHDSQVLRRHNASISAVRNLGAAHARGDVIHFIDADCIVDPAYYSALPAVLREWGAGAAGCKVDLPDSPVWSEEVWHSLHYQARDRYVRSLNSGNLAVVKSAFVRVGGFDEALLTGEDTELCLRLVNEGFRIRESTQLRVQHLGNPRSLHAFYRQQVWHGIGMFGTVEWRSVDRPTAMMLVHLGLSGLGVWLWTARGLEGLLVGLLLQVLVPAATVALRISQTKRLPNIAQAVLLYHMYYWARIQALFLILTRRTGYRK